jgi:hypothetical protein
VRLWTSEARERPSAGRRCFPGVGAATWCLAGWGPLPSFFLLESSPSLTQLHGGALRAAPLPGFLPPSMSLACLTGGCVAARGMRFSSEDAAARRSLLRGSCGPTACGLPWWTRRLDGLSSGGGVERTLKRSGEGAEARSRRSK